MNASLESQTAKKRVLAIEPESVAVVHTKEGEKDIVQVFGQIIGNETEILNYAPDAFGHNLKILVGKFNAANGGQQVRIDHKKLTVSGSGRILGKCEVENGAGTKLFSLNIDAAELQRRLRRSLGV